MIVLDFESAGNLKVPTLTPRLQRSGQIFDRTRFYNCGTRFSRNRANSVTDCNTVCCSTCTISRAPCKLKKDWSVQVFVHSKICPDPCKRGIKLLPLTLRLLANDVKPQARQSQKKTRRRERKRTHIYLKKQVLGAWPFDFTYMATVKSLIHLLFISRVLVDIEHELRSPPAPPFEQKEYYYTCKKDLLCR